MQRIKVTNERTAFLTLWLEPWGEDYGMSPGDECEIIAADAAEDCSFHVVCDEKGVKVYVEGDVRKISVYRGGEELSCGHKRREEMW